MVKAPARGIIFCVVCFFVAKLLAPLGDAAYNPLVSLPDTDPVELIRAIKQGVNVEDNFRRLFDRHYAQILRFFRRKGFDSEECRDLTQETFISVYKGIRELRHDEQFESWLFAIAHNVWCRVIERRSAQKRSAKLLSLEGDDESDDHSSVATRLVHKGADPFTIVLEKEKLEKLSEALEHLPQQMRRCTQLCVVHQLSYVEVAALMDISVNTVKAHLHQARKVLRAKLSSYFEEIEV